MQIQDAIHGYIRLNDLEERILDTPEMQRLRRVTQLGFSQLVYPSATHTRFEHSMGALHLADRFADSLGLEEGRSQELRLAALLHDVGHGPFSHTADFIFEEHGHTHEHFSKQKIQDSRIADILHDHGIHPKRVTKLIDGDGRFGSIIAGHIDVDRMDYLMRDAHYTGVAYGTIDADTIIRAAQLHDQELVFDAKYVNALESLLTARYLMIPTVYRHRTSRIAGQMFRKAFQLLEDATDVTADDLPYMDEPGIRTRLRQCDDTAWLMERLENRELYKHAATVDDGHDPDRLEEQLLDETGMDPGEIIVDEIATSVTRTYDVPVLSGGDVVHLDDLSDIPAALQQSLESTSEIRVYTDRDRVDTVKDAVDSVTKA